MEAISPEVTTQEITAMAEVISMAVTEAVRLRVTSRV